jgi:LacI family transcriptional regulator
MPSKDKIEQPQRTVTRDDVARAAGVSSAVVSYVINNGPKRVAPATAARVRAAVEALGYKPNLTARALSSGSTRMLGLVLIDLLNPFFAELAHSVEAAAARRDRIILITHTNSDPQTERLRIADLEARQVDGLLISTLLPRPELTAWGRQRRDRAVPPVVLLNHSEPVPGFMTIGPDFTAGTRLALEHLIAHGHRRIGLVTGSEAGSHEPRDEAWRQTLTESGLRPGPIQRGHYTRDSGYVMARRMLGRARPPTAIFAASDLLGLGVLRAAQELGVGVPDDLAIVCFDGTRETEFSWPPLTAVRQPLAEMASAAVNRLLDGDAVRTSGHQMFDMDLIIRRSCGCGPE